MHTQTHAQEQFSLLHNVIPSMHNSTTGSLQDKQCLTCFICRLQLPFDMQLQHTVVQRHMHFYKTQKRPSLSHLHAHCVNRAICVQINVLQCACVYEKEIAWYPVLHPCESTANRYVTKIASHLQHAFTSVSQQD